MKAKQVLSELKSMADDRTRETMQKHGAPKDFYGVKIGDMKKIVKKVKVDQPLAEELYASGNGDAMYLAGLIADPKEIKLTTLRRWAKTCTWCMVGEYMVAGVAAESEHGWKLGLEWIEAKKLSVVGIGWNTLSGVVSFRDDDDLDLKKIKSLLSRIKKSIHKAPNDTRYVMNNFVIAVGSYVSPLSEHAADVAKAIGKVEIEMVGSCKVPFAPEYIQKVVKAGRVGKKRKRVRC